MTCILYSTNDRFALNSNYLDDLTHSSLRFYRKDIVWHCGKSDFIILDGIYVELQSLEDFTELANLFGKLIYKENSFYDYPVIEIYDDYRE
jgi:hypothetical protein